MKTYKLIKSYPGSPCFGAVIIEASDIKGKYFIKRNDIWFINNPEKYSEFWEEIIEYPLGTTVFNDSTKAAYVKKEDGWYKTSDKTFYTDKLITECKHINVIPDKLIEKDYEILSFKNLDNNLVYSKYCEHYSNGTSDRTLQYCVLHYKIHSIKRLSDGEIFTIGDKTSFGIIQQIYLDTIKRLWLDFPTYGGYCSENYKNLKKTKTPLFTTEDGVDIFKNDTYYVVAKQNIYESTVDSDYEIKAFDILINNKSFEQYNWNNFWSFSTKEKAEKYILMNKKSLSPNDILKCWSELSKHTEESLMKNSTLMGCIINSLK